MPVHLKMYESTSLSLQPNLNFLFELRNSYDFMLLILSKNIIFRLIDHIRFEIFPKINMLFIFIELVTEHKVFIRVRSTNK